jgi:hypothetical protein
MPTVKAICNVQAGRSNQRASRKLCAVACAGASAVSGLRGPRSDCLPGRGPGDLDCPASRQYQSVAAAESVLRTLCSPRSHVRCRPATSRPSLRLVHGCSRQLIPEPLLWRHGMPQNCVTCWALQCLRRWRLLPSERSAAARMHIPPASPHLSCMLRTRQVIQAAVA